MRNQAKYHNSNWFVFPPLPPLPPHNFLLPPAVSCFLLLIIIVLLFSFSQMNFNRNWTARAFNQNSNQNRSNSKINIHVAFDTVSSTPNEWPALFIRHTHTHTHSYTCNGGSWGDPSAQPPTRHIPPFEGVLQNIPIHQRELIAQEYIGYKSLRYISSVHQLAYFLCHSSIILRITSANFQNSKFEIRNSLSIRDKVPFECCPLLLPARARGQFHSWAYTYMYVTSIYCAYVCMCMLYMYL